MFAADSEQKNKTISVIRDNAGFIRRELARVMNTRTVPALTFLPDGSMEYGSKMDELFTKLHKDEDR